MKTSTIVWLVVIILIMLVGWYWYVSAGVQKYDTASAPTASTSNQVSNATTTSDDGSDIRNNLTLGTDGNASLGTYLIGYNGMTLYSFSKDMVGSSTCYGACTTTWPPYGVPAAMSLHLEAGVSGNASTILRADGITQVTYNGKPLYFYVGDKTGSDTAGQNNGGTWSIVKP